MKLLLDDAGNVVMRNGKPVYVQDDGKEVEFDAAGTIATISRLKGEAQNHREAKEAAIAEGKTLKEQLAVFDGLDVEAARTAMDTLKKVDLSKMVGLDKVDEVRGAVAKEYETRMTAAQTAHQAALAEAKAQNEKLTGTLNSELIGGGFLRSEYIAKNLAIPADMVQARFGSHFKLDDAGKIVAHDASGNLIWSRARPGEAASFDEAIGELVAQYPQRDHILKASGATGSGAAASVGSKGQDGKSITREAFAAMPPAAQAAHARSGLGITD